MRIILAILTIFTLASGQAYNRLLPFFTTGPKATALNGSSQYWAKASPSNVDFNGSEVLTNGTFDANVAGWAGVDASIAYETTTKRTGAGSCKVTSTGGLNGYLASNNVANTTNGNFTFECWVYAPTATVLKTVRLQVRNQSLGTLYQSGNTTLVANTWTKLVVNGASGGSQTGLRVAIQWVGTPTAGDIIYVDDASLKQAYDAVWGGFIRTSASGVQTICAAGFSSSLRTSMFLNNNTATVTVSDGTTSVSATNSATVNDGRHHAFFATLSRTGNLTLYVDGVAGTGVSATAVGIIAVDSIYVGRGLTGSYFNGQIEQRQRIRYTSLPSDIAQQLSDIYAQGKLKPPYGEGVITTWYDWRSGGYDKSGNGNNLTPVNSPLIINVQK